MPEDPRVPGPAPGRQLLLFQGVAARPLDPVPPSEPHDLASGLGSGLSPDVGQIELFSDRVVLARDLDLALEAGRFVEAARILDAIEEAFGLSTHSTWRPWLSRLAATTWEEAPAGALDTWAEVDEQLAQEPALQRPVFTGAFTRLLSSHSPQALDAVRPRSLPALFRALASGLGRRPEEGLIEARGLVRDALLAERSLEALDFQADRAVADLLAEDFAPRWLACAASGWAHRSEAPSFPLSRRLLGARTASTTRPRPSGIACVSPSPRTARTTFASRHAGE